MLRTLTAVTAAAVFSVGLATAVTAAQLKGGGPPVGGPSVGGGPSLGGGPALGGGGNFHPGASTFGGPGPVTGNAIRPNTAMGPRPLNGNWKQSSNQPWNWHDRDHDHDRFRHHRHGFGFGLFAYGPDYYDYGYDYSCYQRRLVPTPHGWRWRFVWVCGYPYY